MTMAMHVQSRSASRTDSIQAELVEQFLQRLQAGEMLDPSEFAAQYPEHAEALRQLLPALQMMAELSRSAVRDRSSLPFSDAVSGPELGVVGDFRILREVGRGGMGVVYEAEQLSLHRRVALKVLPLAGGLDPRQLQRFKIEAQAAALLHHTNIVPIHAVGCERGVHYYAMQFIDGRTLTDVISELRQLEGKARLRDNPLPPAGGKVAEGRMRGDCRAETRDRGSPDACPRVATTPSSIPSSRTREFIRRAVLLGIQAAEALDHAHVHGVIHRDIKPANLLLDASGCLWVTDFGLARLQDDTGLTMTGDLLGTLRYMSPEQALAKRGYLDHRTDIYSLGATLYELLTLRPAIEGQDRQEVLRKIAQEEPTPPRRLDPTIPRELETILLKAMSKEPQSRYATAQELADDLERFLEHKPIRARRPTLLERAAKWSRRHRAVVATAFLFLLLAVVTLATSTVMIARQQREVVRQRDRARKAVDEMYTEVAQKWLSQQPQLELLQREFLLKAMAFYQDFARERGTDPEARRGSALAEKNAGDILSKLGEPSRAESAYRRAVEAQESLVTEFPKVPAYRMELANSSADLSILLRVAGRLAEAERTHNRALELREALVAESPKVPDHRKDLALSYNMLGYGLRERSRFAEAERSVRRAIELLDSLVAEFPKVAGYRGHLADFFTHLGGLHFEKGDPAEAERAFRRAIALKEAISAEFPEISKGPRHRQTLAHAYNNVGVLLVPVPSRFVEAEQAFRRALELEEPLAVEFPKVPDYRKALANSYLNLGGLLRVPGRLAEAERSLCRAIEVLEALVAQSPDVPDTRSRLGASLNNLGDVQTDMGALAAATSSYRRAIEQQRAALGVNPSNPMYRRFLRNHYVGMADALEKQGDHAGAAQAAEEYARVSPHRARDSVHAANAIVRCRQMAEADSRLSIADRQAKVRDYAGRAARLLKEGTGAVADDPEALNGLAWFLATCPDPQFRDPARAVELARKAVDRAPQAGNSWNTLGVAAYRAGEWDDAIKALSRSMELTSGGSAGDWLFLAMAHWQKGDKDTARSRYDKAVAWMDQNPSRDEELIRFRAEAMALLRVEDPDALMPNGVAAFAPTSADGKEEATP